MKLLGAYYRLAKPGIVYGNVLSAVAGFLLASRGHIAYWLFIALVVGIALVIASACVINNYLDRRIDAKMARTSQRALVVGSIPVKNALIYALILGISGFWLLVAFTNWLTVVVGIIGYIDYVVVYGIAKRKTAYGTILGSISGAASLVAGYTAVIGRLDLTVLLLFLVMVYWQMAHFHAIALYRLDDYSAAGLPVLPVRKGQQSTRLSIQLYIIGFIILTILLAVVGKVGYVYLMVIFIVGWLWFLAGLKPDNDYSQWARHMFKLSLIVLLVFCLLLMTSGYLP